jgi:hypothetical protein
MDADGSVSLNQLAVDSEVLIVLGKADLTSLPWASRVKNVARDRAVALCPYTGAGGGFDGLLHGVPQA